MKRLFALIVLMSFFGCAGSRITVREFAQDQIIHVNEFMKVEDTGKIGQYAVYLEKGDTFPLELTIKSDFLGLKQNQVDVIAKEKLFFMFKLSEKLTKEELYKLENLDQNNLSGMSEEEKMKLFKDSMMYVSKDAVTWAPLNDIKAVKKAFGIKGGFFSFGMGMSKASGIWSFLGVETVR